ncbi:MAG TPA: class I SAM-dependent methyltransferase [Desulfuromonadales bacterium]|nr:class I SAM-dependent methyltransferase [Desulfuromonadales bacterium]
MTIDVSPDWWKSLFDEVYLLTDARSVCNQEVTRREIDLVCKLLPLQADHRVLDLCGGQGRHSIELARRGYRNCTVLDYSQVLLALGRKAAAEQGQPVAFIQGDATATSLDPDRFDHVLILGNSLGYLPAAEDDLRIMQEALRLLKSGGRLLVDVTDGSAVRAQFNPNAWHEIADDIVVCRQRELEENLIRAREVVICKNRGLLRDHSYAIRIYDPANLQALLHKAGFTAIDVRKGFSSGRSGEDYGFMNHRLVATACKPAA